MGNTDAQGDPNDETPRKQAYQINWASIPLGSLYQLVFTRTQDAVTAVNYSIIVARQRADRLLTQSEFDSLAFHHAKVLAQRTISISELGIARAFFF